MYPKEISLDISDMLPFVILFLIGVMFILEYRNRKKKIKTIDNEIKNLIKSNSTKNEHKGVYIIDENSLNDLSIKIMNLFEK